MLPQYEITGIVGRGGMGAVYRGRQSKLDRDVAIKLLPESLAGADDDLHFAERFEQEARAMANLDHPAIVSVFDFGETSNGQLFLVMEFIDGMDIHQYLHRNGGRLPQEEALAITAHVLDALEYAHDHGIVHRDIKPANVLLNHEGRVKIADFGLAKRFGDHAGESAPALTMTNMAVGTPDFLAPEALDPTRTPDNRADLFAVGVMLYQMLTGSLPRGIFRLPSELLPELDPRLDEVVGKSLETNPDDRFASASAVRHALDPVITSPMSRIEFERQSAHAQSPDAVEALPATNLPPPHQHPRSLERSQTAIYLWIGAVTLFAVVVALVLMLGGNGDKDPLPISGSGDSDKVVRDDDLDVSAGPGGSTSALGAELAPRGATPKPPSGNGHPNTAAVRPSEAVSQPPTSIAVPSSLPISPATTEPPLSPALEESSPLASIPGFTARFERYLKARNSQIADLATKYLRGIESRINQAADSGDLKLVTALRDEMARVEALSGQLENSSADPISAVRAISALAELTDDAPEALVALRGTWTTEREKIRTSLDGDLQQSLRALETELTKARDFDNAQQILAFRESLGGSATVATAAAPASTKTPSPKVTPSLGSPSAAGKATKDAPFVNSLGMKFVPVPIRGGPTNRKRVLFSIWETRVSDYEAFSGKPHRTRWPEVDVSQDDTHPAVDVSWIEATAFCTWLTEKDRAIGLLGRDEAYRMPTDHEWSCAMGVGQDEDPAAAPLSKRYGNNKSQKYPWGDEWPPPEGAGNFNGEENPASQEQVPIEGHRDTFPRTAPVGSFNPNQYGLFDLGGNVMEWCEDLVNPAGQPIGRWHLSHHRVQRDSPWSYGGKGDIRTIQRWSGDPVSYQSSSVGFRIVVAPMPSRTPSVSSSASATKKDPFVNLMGMKFVPVPIPGGPTKGKRVMFSIWETRVTDYEAFSRKQRRHHWKDPDVEQNEHHPVVNVSWHDAVAFCASLTEADRKAGLIGDKVEYRLPTDYEWACAVGTGKDEDPEAPPQARVVASLGNEGSDFYWGGREWPPPNHVGNLFGEENAEKTGHPNRQIIEGFNDGHPCTAPVGSFRANNFGLCDLGGNVSEWCEDIFDPSAQAPDDGNRVVRDAAWSSGGKADARMRTRGNYNPSEKNTSTGFRVVLAPVRAVAGESASPATGD